MTAAWLCVSCADEHLRPLAVEHLDDLLTPEDLAALHRDLAEMAAKRRRAWASASTMWFT